jgi:hypothetical protein
MFARLMGLERTVWAFAFKEVGFVRVNFVTYGTGYCDVCGRDENLVIVGELGTGVCKKCLPAVVEQMKAVGHLLQSRQDEEN